jgi:hypothetical protein
MKTKGMIQIFPNVTLSNGVRVLNFSSPHSFVFDDGTVLPACEPDHVERGAMDVTEDETPDPALGTIDVELKFELNWDVLDLLSEADTYDVDIILVPLPVLTALRGNLGGIGRCRTCRVVDRQSKVISSTKFCV